MKLIAWDTSSKTGALAALEWNPGDPRGRDGLRLVSEWSLNLDANQHSERLMWSIDRMLQAAGWKIGDIDVFGVGVGPGSFTGLRIGLTTARTLASTLNKPLVGVSSLAALARPASSWLSTGKKSSPFVIACTDACKGELFAVFGHAKPLADCVALAEGDDAGLWSRGVEEAVLKPSELLTTVQKKLGKTGGWIAVGDGTERYQSMWDELPKSRRVLLPHLFANQVQGRFVAQLAWEGYQAGLGRDALRVHPRYVRASDAEIKLKAGLLPAGPSRGL
jgi:tRNA threonylcarbamoyladenosine biosynthesis protein TsaB